MQRVRALPPPPQYNRTRVAHALYKIVKLFGVKSVCDMPAAAHHPWLQPTLSQLAFETPSFEYTAIERNRSQLARIRAALQPVLDVNGASQLAANGSGGAQCELLFYWPPALHDGSGGAARLEAAAMLNNALGAIRSAKAARLTHVIVAQSASKWARATLLFRAGRWSVLEDGVRTAPFALNEHVKGAIPIGCSPHRDAVYMTLYALRSIPSSALQ